MIVVDTSAILCLVQREREARTFAAIMAAGQAFLPVSCRVECAISARRRGISGTVLETLLEKTGLILLPADERQALLAVAADLRFGRGTGHPARLNFGDCLAYAAAVAHDAPLLFKGADFAQTDVRRAI